MTNTEKGLRIAIFDNRIQQNKTYSEGDLELSALTEKYLTDLNYIIPVWIKAWRLLNSNTPINLEDVLNLFAKKKKCYQKLFDDTYALIVVTQDTVF